MSHRKPRPEPGLTLSVNLTHEQSLWVAKYSQVLEMSPAAFVTGLLSDEMSRIQAMLADVSGPRADLPMSAESTGWRILGKHMGYPEDADPSSGT